jgi:hypothetical protein
MATNRAAGMLTPPGAVALPLLFAAIAGYVVALPAYLWHRRDLRSFHKPVWARYGSRSRHQTRALLCYLAAGWPELFLALSWRSSITREGLLLERENFRAERRDSGLR